MNAERRRTRIRVCRIEGLVNSQATELFFFFAILTLAYRGHVLLRRSHKYELDMTYRDSYVVCMYICNGYTIFYAGGRAVSSHQVLPEAANRFHLALISFLHRTQSSRKPLSSTLFA